MKVILTEEVPKLGAPGQVVDVAPGYARNYLLPRKLAVEATRGNVRALEHHRRTIEARQKKLAQSAQALAQRLGTATITLTARAGEAGRLYGSITTADIAQELQRALGIELDRRKIEIPEPIKVLGEHQVRVRLHRDVETTLTVMVVAEAAPTAAAPTESAETTPPREVAPVQQEGVAAAGESEAPAQ